MSARSPLDDPSVFEFLVSPPGQEAMARLAQSDLGEAHTLALLGALRRDLSPGQAGAALALARLRRRADGKFRRADAMFFTAEALEQSSGEIVSRWRARRFAQAGYSWAADLACGIGGDALALAALPGASVLGVDLDPLRLRMARANLGAYGLAASWLRADLAAPLPLAGVRAAFFDPGRREEGRRVFSLRDYSPPLRVIEGWPFEALAVKLSPGVDLDELRPYTDRAGMGIEFVSLAGELKEAVLWRGAWAFEGRWASRLEPDGTGQTLTPAGLPSPPLSPPRAYLYEPDPSVIRAGLFGELAGALGIALFRLDEQIAYLTGDTLIQSNWARAWSILEWMPFQLKRLRAALRARGVGRVTVKKRGSPLSPEELIQRLKLGGEGESAVVVLTQVQGQPAAVICSD